MSDSGIALRTGSDLAHRLMRALRDASFLPTIYPSLFLTGVDEGSLHAYMLSALVLVGDRLGYTPVCDSPIFDRLDKLLTGEGAKRPDALWLRRGTSDVCCLVEFERYTIRSLAPKAQNLLVMSKELWPKPELVVLNYWTYDNVDSPKLDGVRRLFEQGFRHPLGVAFPPLPCPALVLQTVVQEQPRGVIVVRVAPRLMVAEGEDKPYLVEDLAMGSG